MTPMVRKNFEDDPHLKALWEKENMVSSREIQTRYSLELVADIPLAWSHLRAL